jgi:hypothetical protein
MSKTVKGYSLILKDKKTGKKTLKEFKIYEVTEEGEKVCVKRFKNKVDDVNDEFKVQIKEILNKMRAVDDGVSAVNNYDPVVVPVVSVNNNAKNAVNDIVKTISDNTQNGPVNQENNKLNFSAKGIKNIQNYVIKNQEFKFNENYTKIIYITNEILNKYVNYVKNKLKKEEITEDYFNKKLNIIFILFCKMVINYKENNKSDMINNNIDNYLENLIQAYLYEKEYKSYEKNTDFDSAKDLLNEKYKKLIENMRATLPTFNNKVDKQIDGKIFAQDGTDYLLLMNENEKNVFAFVHLSSDIQSTKTESDTQIIKQNKSNNIPEAIAAAIETTPNTSGPNLTSDPKDVLISDPKDDLISDPNLTSDPKDDLTSNITSDPKDNVLTSSNNEPNIITSDPDNKNKTVKNPNPANNCCDKRGGRRTYKNNKKRN